MSEAIGGKKRILRVARSALCRKMKQAAKIIVCLVLCLALVWGYSYYEPVKVHATGVAEAVFAGVAAGASAVGIGLVAGGAIVAVAIGALGIGVGATVRGVSYQAECEHIYQNLSYRAKADLIVLGVVGKPILNIGKIAATEITAAVMGSMALAQNISSAKSEIGALSFPGEYTLSELALKLNLGQGITYAYKGWNKPKTIQNLKILSEVTAGTALFYSLKNGNVMVVKTSVLNSHLYANEYIFSSGYDYVANNYSGYIDSCSPSFGRGAGTHKGHISVVSCLMNGAYTLGLLLFGNFGEKVSEQTAENEVGYLYFLDSSVVANEAKGLGDDTINVADRAWWAKEMSTLTTNIDSYFERILAAQGRTGSISAYPNTASSAEQANSDWLDTLRNKVLTDIIGATIAVTAAEKALQDTFNKTRDITIPALPNPVTPPEKPPEKPSGLPDLDLPLNISKKFPFCIPFDVYMIVSGFYCAEAKAPKWTIPIVNQRLGWKWNIDVDFSQFESLAVLCRWFNGALWVFGLILVTRKLIGAGGGD